MHGLPRLPLPGLPFRQDRAIELSGRMTQLNAVSLLRFKKLTGLTMIIAIGIGIAIVFGSQNVSIAIPIMIS